MLAQAEARCHRIGQNRKVNIFFPDVATTIDEVLAHVSSLKESNARIILGDGTEIASSEKSDAGDKKITGVFGTLVSHAKSVRASLLQTDSRLSPIGQESLAMAANVSRISSISSSTRPMAMTKNHPAQRAKMPPVCLQSSSDTPLEDLSSFGHSMCHAALEQEERSSSSDTPPEDLSSFGNFMCHAALEEDSH